MSILDHISLNVTDYTKSKAFYDKALKPLGASALVQFGEVAGYGKGSKPDLWIGAGKSDFQTAEQVKVLTPTHICFAASSRAEVNAFYQAAIEAGGRDNGAPGIRPHYHANYYAAFVFDPDGHNIEAVFHGAE